MSSPKISPAGMRIMRILVGRPPQTVADLIEATGVTRTAVTEQLNELAAEGFVQRDTERVTGRGRPRHVYSATNAAMTALFGNYHDRIVPAIWKAIRTFGGDALVQEILDRVSHDLARHYRPRVTATSPRKRLAKFAELLRGEGIVVDLVEEDGKLVMWKRSCPFSALLDDKRHVCCVDEAVTLEIVGRGIRRIADRHEGDACCGFAVNGEV